MPGLVGIISLNWNDRIDACYHGKMCNAIMHRSWYIRSHASSDHNSFAISRLHHGLMNLVDTPVQHAETKTTVIIDGEIYNELPQDMNQSEFVLDLYLSRGHRFVEALNGTFNIIIIDQQKKLITLFNDRTASRPLFWFKDDRYFYFSPEIKSFLRLPTFKREVNKGAVSIYHSKI